MISKSNIKMTKKEAEILDGFKIYDEENVIVKNPFSGVEVELTPEAVAIYDILTGCQNAGEWCNTHEDIEKTAQLFYAAKDVFLRNWPKEYNLLVD